MALYKFANLLYYPCEKNGHTVCLLLLMHCCDKPTTAILEATWNVKAHGRRLHISTRSEIKTFLESCNYAWLFKQLEPKELSAGSTINSNITTEKENIVSFRGNTKTEGIWWSSHWYDYEATRFRSLAFPFPSTLRNLRSKGEFLRTTQIVDSRPRTKFSFLPSAVAFFFLNHITKFMQLQIP